MAIIELYNTHKILPLAARLDAAEGALHYLTAPWWRRRLWDAKIIGAKVYNWVYKWLERRGIHLYTLDISDTEAEKPPEKELEMTLTVTNRGGARGGFGCAPRGASCGDDVSAHTNGLPGPGVHS